MSRYRKKPVVVEAFKIGVDYIPDWFMDAVTANEVILHGTSSGFDHVDDTNADIHTLEGWLHASYGDYIIRGAKGEIYPCKPDIFDMTYDVGNKPQTNADRIRAMSDEELEPMILAFKLGYAPWCDHHCKNEGEYGCDTCILNWLKQPAEGENNAED